MAPLKPAAEASDAHDCGMVQPLRQVAVFRRLGSGRPFVSAHKDRLDLFRPGRRSGGRGLGPAPRDILNLLGRHFDVLELTEERDDQRGFWHALMKRRGQAEVGARG